MIISVQNEKKYDYIFLDLDGPILDGKKRHYFCYSEIIEEGNGKPIDINNYWEGKRNLENRISLIEKSKYKLDYSTFLETWKERIETKKFLKYDELKKDTPQALNILTDACKELILITRRHNRENLLWQLKQFKINKFFAKIINCPFGDKLAKYEAVKNYKFEKAIFIGDTEEDTEAALMLGIQSIAILNGLRDKMFLKADFYFNELIDFAKNISNIDLEINGG